MNYTNHLELTQKYPDSVILNISLTKCVIIDKEFEYLKNHKWHIDANGYVRRRHIAGSLGKYGIRKHINKFKYLHHEILPKKSYMMVDHINGDILDNRKCNLRYATASQNCQNSKPSRGRKYKGTHKTPSGKYSASVSHKYLGTFLTEEEAALKYNEEASKLYGEFARLNVISI